MPRLIERQGWVEVVNRAGRWRIATTASGVRSAGPGYVYRLARADGRVLVDDSKRGQGWVNDPSYGGLGVFGWHHARRLDRGQLGPPDQFGPATVPAVDHWRQNNAWPIDGRTLASRSSGFGVTVADVLESNDDLVKVRVTFGDPWDPGFVRATYSWGFDQWGAELRFVVKLYPPAGPPAFVKEPKLAFSLAGCDSLRCGYVRTTRALPRTAQSSPRARSAEFVGTGVRLERLAVFPAWAEKAARRERFGPDDGPGDEITWDCHGGVPRQTFELVGWRGDETRLDFRHAAILLCAWTGGRGPYDCEPLSRRVVAETHTARLAIRLEG